MIRSASSALQLLRQGDVSADNWRSPQFKLPVSSGPDKAFAISMVFRTEQGAIARKDGEGLPAPEAREGKAFNL